MPQEIGEKLDHVVRLTERLLIKLFGEVDEETPTGRLPQLEAKVEDHERRMRFMERYVFRIGGAIGVLAALAEVFSRFIPEAHR